MLTYFIVFFLFASSLANNITTSGTVSTTEKPQSTACGLLKYYVPPSTIKYPYIYGEVPSDNKCMYSISTAYGSRISIYFEYYTLYPGSSLIVYDGLSNTSPILIGLGSGLNYTVGYTSSSNHMLVSLKTYSKGDDFLLDVQTTKSKL